MVWGKRQFPHSEFTLYHDRLIKLLYRFPAQYREFMLVAAKTENPLTKTYYVGVPMDVFMTAFDGFELIEDQALPEEIDTVIVGDVTSGEFKSRFQFRKHSSARIARSVPLTTPEQLGVAK